MQKKAVNKDDFFHHVDSFFRFRLFEELVSE